MTIHVKCLPPAHVTRVIRCHALQMIVRICKRSINGQIIGYSYQDTLDFEDSQPHLAPRTSSPTQFHPHPPTPPPLLSLTHQVPKTLPAAPICHTEAEECHCCIFQHCWLDVVVLGQCTCSSIPEIKMKEEGEM